MTKLNQMILNKVHQVTATFYVLWPQWLNGQNVFKEFSIQNKKMILALIVLEYAIWEYGKIKLQMIKFLVTNGNEHSLLMVMDLKYGSLFLKRFGLRFMDLTVKLNLDGLGKLFMISLELQLGLIVPIMKDYGISYQQENKIII